jgi:hypothetical protein
LIRVGAAANHGVQSPVAGGCLLLCSPHEWFLVQAAYQLSAIAKRVSDITFRRWSVQGKFEQMHHFFTGQLF